MKYKMEIEFDNKNAVVTHLLLSCNGAKYNWSLHSFLLDYPIINIIILLLLIDYYCYLINLLISAHLTGLSSLAPGHFSQLLVRSLIKCLEMENSVQEFMCG